MLYHVLCVVYVCVHALWVYGYCTVSLTLELSFTVNCFSPPSTALSANEQGVPSESYLEEVREQLEERREETEENQHQRQTRSASDIAGLYQWVMQSSEQCVCSAQSENLRILGIPRLRTIVARCRDCAIHLRDLEIAQL